MNVGDILRAVQEAGNFDGYVAIAYPDSSDPYSVDDFRVGDDFRGEYDSDLVYTYAVPAWNDGEHWLRLPRGWGFSIDRMSFIRKGDSGIEYEVSYNAIKSIWEGADYLQSIRVKAPTAKEVFAKLGADLQVFSV